MKKKGIPYHSSNGVASLRSGSMHHRGEWIAFCERCEFTSHYRRTENRARRDVYRHKCQGPDLPWTDAQEVTF